MENKKELWSLFTAKHEYDSGIRDKYNRHPFYLSRNRNVFHPSVSDYLLRNGLQPTYPDNKKFAICLTHDVDYLYHNQYLKTLPRHMIDGTKSLLSLNYKAFKNTLSSVLNNEIHTSKRNVVVRRNSDWSVSKTLDFEKKYNAKSTFYFLSLSEGEQGFNYNLSDIKDVLQEMEFSNCEIGLHGGHLAYNNLNKLKDEKQKLESILNKKITGYRNHYLRFETPKTWEILEQLNFKYDTTFGYADCVGFRNGMCHPFQPYSNNNNTFLNIIELPLIIMDNTMSKYMNLDVKQQFEICKNLIDTVENHNGVLTFLWHNTEMTDAQGEFYNAFLKYVFGKNAWITSAIEIVDWWQENDFIEKSKNIFEQLKH